MPVRPAISPHRRAAASSLRRVIVLFWLLASGFCLLPAARAQTTPVTFNDLLPRAAGPLTPQQQQEANVRKLVGTLGGGGLPAGAVVPASTDRGTNPQAGAVPLPDLSSQLPTTTDPKKLSSSIQILLLLSVLTLAPSILLMTTCFTRIVIVMSLLRQALGAAQLPPNQILIGLSLFMTFLVMGPTWSKVNTEAITPYSNNEISQSVAFDRAKGILREFMIKQVEAAHNEDDVYLFHHYAHPGSSNPKTWEEVDTTTLVPAFVLSELKVAFLMGFRIYLPFLIIDMVISSVLISIGMQLLPPVMVSLPFKLLLFVLVDGWHLVCATLLASFTT
jgi:flagellar biosynthetic protein FliP